MSQVAFLVDENVPASVVPAVLSREPSIRIPQVGVDPTVPPKGTLDPDLLAFAEAEGFALVTFDKDTMPGHIGDHLASGKHTLGVFIFPDGNSLSPGRIADELIIVWVASQAEEWIDRIEYLP
jgi:Domain of unknown function (DUF5615)